MSTAHTNDNPAAQAVRGEQISRVPGRIAGRPDEDGHAERVNTAPTADHGIDSPAPRRSPRPPGTTGQPTRIGAVQLDAIRLGLSRRDGRVLESFRQHRFLTTSDVQRWHFADHASPLTAVRTSRRVLRRLEALGVIARLARRVGGFDSGSAESVWHLTPAGERIVQGSSQRRSREPSPAFLAHELGVARLHLGLVETERTGTARVIDFVTEPDCWRRFPSALGATTTLKPDFFSVVGSRDFEAVSFGEYDRGTESVQTIVKKASVYERYWQSGQEQSRSGVFPRVVWIVPDDKRRQRVERALGRTARITSALHAVTTPEWAIAVLRGDEPYEGGTS